MKLFDNDYLKKKAVEYISTTNIGPDEDKVNLYNNNFPINRHLYKPIISDEDVLKYTSNITIDDMMALFNQYMYEKSFSAPVMDNHNRRIITLNEDLIIINQLLSIQLLRELGVYIASKVNEETTYKELKLIFSPG